MKIRITFDLSKCAREAISHHYGDEKPATHEACKSFINSEITNFLELMIFDIEQTEEREREKRLENYYE